MLQSVKNLTRHLKAHDACLYAQETTAGRIDVMRKSRDGSALPHYVFSLTDTWNAKGVPVAWGIDVVLNRIKAHDLWRDDTFVDQWITSQGKIEESKARAFRGSIESFLYDFRKDFQRATKDINTSTLEKKEPSYGYC